MAWSTSLIRLNPSARYALQGMMLIARHHPKPMLVKDIARSTGLPKDFLAKILQRLAGVGLLRSQRGRGGGYSLHRSPADIRTSDILNAFETKSDAARQCFLYERPCRSVKSCPVHETVDQACQQMASRVATLTLAELAADPYHIPGETTSQP